MKTTLTLLFFSLCIWVQAQTVEQFSSDQVINDLVLFEGQLWLASESGILVFDTLGNEIRRYNLANGLGDYSSEFSSIGIANNGTLYVSKNGILGKTWEYNSSTSSWTKLSIGKAYFINDEIGYFSYKYFHHSTNDKKAKTVLPFSYYNNPIIADLKHNKWLFEEDILLKVDKNSYQYTADTFPNVEIKAVFYINDTIWVQGERADTNVLFKRGSHLWENKDYDLGNSFRSILYQADDFILFQNEGVLYKFDGQKITYHSTNPLPKSPYTPWFNTIKQDENGTYWATLSNKNRKNYIYKYANNKWEPISLQSKTPQVDFYGVEENELHASWDSSIWAISTIANLLLHYVDNQWDSIPFEGLSRLSLNPYDSTVWVGTSQGVHLLKDGKWSKISSESVRYFYHQNATATYAFIIEDEKKTIQKWNGIEWDYSDYDILKRLNEIKYFTVYHNDENVLWFGDYFKGDLNSFDGKAIKPFMLDQPVFDQYTIDRIHFIYQTKDYLGIVVKVKNKSRLQILKKYKTGYKKASGSPYYGFEFNKKAIDQSGNTWLITKKGVEYIDYETGKKKVSKRSKNLSELCIAPNGTIWANGAQTLFSLKNKKWTKHNFPLTSSGKKLLVNGQTIWILGFEVFKITL